MSGAFIIAGILVVITILYALLSEFARMMSSAPITMPSRFVHILVTGFILAALVASTHFLGLRW